MILRFFHSFERQLRNCFNGNTSDASTIFGIQMVHRVRGLMVVRAIKVLNEIDVLVDENRWPARCLEGCVSW